jgi:hypothetical protein
VVFFAAFDLDFARPLTTSLIALAPGQLLLENRGSHNTDLVAAAGGQFLQDDALFDRLDALDVGDLLGADLDDDLREGVELGVLQRDLQRSLGDDRGGVLGRIRAGWWGINGVWGGASLPRYWGCGEGGGYSQAAPTGVSS